MLLPSRIEIEGGLTVLLEWEDGGRQELASAVLRDNCPCVGCRELRSTGAVVVPDPAAVTISGAELVGDYAINFVFQPDNHHTGIFSFDLLRGIAP